MADTELDLVQEARKTWWEIVESDEGECRLMGIVRELADEVERLRRSVPPPIEPKLGESARAAKSIESVLAWALANSIDFLVANYANVNDPRNKAGWADADAYSVFDEACAALDLRNKQESSADARDGWRTIDSAPKDGTLILLYEDCEPACVQIGRWEEDGQCWAADPGGWSVEVAMWQPLPSPPSLNQEGKRG